MAEFVRERGLSLALVILVISAAALAQGSISYTFVFGELRGPLGLNLAPLADFGYSLRWGLAALMAASWLLKKKRLLFMLVIVVNALATLVLLLHTGILTSVLAGLSAKTVKDILLDVVLLGISNILIFSIWYWVIDPPGIEKEQNTSEKWAFLFPQRGDALPNFEDWQPRYADYLFVAFTTRTAKMLMLVQATISVITLTGIAGSAINILAGTASAR